MEGDGAWKGVKEEQGREGKVVEMNGTLFLIFIKMGI